MGTHMVDDILHTNTNLNDMLTHDKKGLVIFDDFVIDTTLPKHAKNVVSDVEGNSINIGGTVSGTRWMIPSSGGSIENQEFNSAWLHLIERRRMDYDVNPTFRNRMRLYFTRVMKRYARRLLMRNVKAEEKPDNGESTEQFFTRLKESFSEIKKKKEVGVVDFYVSHIKQARELGQTALVESLLHIQNTVKNELFLLTCGFNKYVGESDIIKFHKATNVKNLHLTWIKNFNRIIPFDVFAKKTKADECEIFDNYVVLHTDITGVSIKETDKERKERIEREKDPILFGVLKGSRKLYFIGDWEDEYCDLTLDKVMETLEKKVSDTLSPEDIKKSIESVRHD